jgi:hypothetical protein
VMMRGLACSQRLFLLLLRIADQRTARHEELFSFVAAFSRHGGQCAEKQGDRRTKP